MTEQALVKSDFDLSLLLEKYSNFYGYLQHPIPCTWSRQGGWLSIHRQQSDPRKDGDNIWKLPRAPEQWIACLSLCLPSTRNEKKAFHSDFLMSNTVTVKKRIGLN